MKRQTSETLPTSHPQLQYTTENFLPSVLQWAWCLILLSCRQAFQRVHKCLDLVIKKSRGSDSIKPPPPAHFRTCLWTAAGVGLTLWLLGGVSRLANATTGEGLLLAPFGAFLTLQYSLTAAPASQPRNAIYGQITCLTIAGISSQVFAWIRPTLLLPEILLLPSAVAAGIATMQRLGITHPPAAAAMVAVMTRPVGFTWTAALWLLVGNALAVAIAVFVNNSSEHRQYPVYWQWGLLREMQLFIQRIENCFCWTKFIETEGADSA